MRDYAILTAVVVLLFQPAEPAIVTKPSDALVSVGSRVVFECSTDIEKTAMNWAYVPVGSNAIPLEFYYSGVFANIDEYSTERYSVDTRVPGHYDLIIYNVTAKHAGRYECRDDEGSNGIKVSAELNVVENEPNCHSGNYSFGGLEITCATAVVGNQELSVVCHDGWVTSPVSGFKEDFREERNGSVKRYLSAKTRLKRTTSATRVICSILLPGERFRPLVYVYQPTQPARTHGEVYDLVASNVTVTNTALGKFIDPLLITVIVATVVFVVTVVGALILYTRDRRRTRNAYRYRDHATFNKENYGLSEPSQV